MLAPIGLDAINGDGGVECEGETEDLEEQSKRHSRTPFEKATKSECDEVGEDKRDGRRSSALRANEGLNHRHSILPINRRWNKPRRQHLPRFDRSRQFLSGPHWRRLHKTLFFFRGE